MKQYSLLPVVLAWLTLTACSQHSAMSSATDQVKFKQGTPPANCQLLGSATGEKSNWLSGADQGASMRAAAEDLKQKALHMGGNAIYQATTPAGHFWDSFIPVASQLSGQVYRCPSSSSSS